jgi:hypothetical protein
MVKTYDDVCEEAIGDVANGIGRVEKLWAD